MIINKGHMDGSCFEYTFLFTRKIIFWVRLMYSSMKEVEKGNFRIKEQYFLVLNNHTYFTMLYIKCTFWHLRWNYCLLTIFESIFPLASKSGATKFEVTYKYHCYSSTQEKRELSNHISHFCDDNFVKPTICNL